MKILYLITNTTGDEIAITRALQSLGCFVTRVYDNHLDNLNINNLSALYDLLLFNHSKQLEKISGINIPKVFWCFDLMTENVGRWSWVQEAIRVSDLGFFTDGECVDKFPDKAVWLPQGAQEVKTGEQKYSYDVTFAGIVHSDRTSLIHGIAGKFNLHIIDKVYGDDFADLVASSKIMIAPDTPIKERYWSNRVYMVLGYGGFLLHPYIEELSVQYIDGQEIVFYHSRKDLHNKIRQYLDNQLERARISNNGLARTKKEHTYKHRCKVLLQNIKERLSLSLI